MISSTCSEAKWATSKGRNEATVACCSPQITNNLLFVAPLLARSATSPSMA